MTSERHPGAAGTPSAVPSGGARPAPPPGRYGRSAPDDARTDRRLRMVGAGLGALFLAFLVWTGISVIGGERVTGTLTGFTVVSDEEVEAVLQVRKPADGVGVCTVRSQAEDGLEVGRAQFRFEAEGEVELRAVTLRTTQRGTSAELLGCVLAEG
ncbi:DUF4307 domain-containing protein [Streptomyces alkaliphilus]|uniref:DUF4307 domain-containing protein n=1 Tax=Streptomyces alkaliphilus TaxID=1472722 RepID=A0A7W3TC05_9ACTN|nr:DUF4307 domain-containing protein [Streptomyces alkaliphilus]MBB0243982.1 DUF4307 domain-containing protein [Streptomyces alkaliphilus]